MKLSEFSKPALTGEAPAPPASGTPSEDGLKPRLVTEEVTPEPVLADASAPQEELGTTSVTPSGIEVYYQPARDEPKQRRLYRVNGLEVPSVTNVLGVLEKPALVWWGMKVGVEGAIKLGEDYDVSTFTVDEAVALLTEHKLTVNHVKDRAADRGVNVHNALEGWTKGEMIPASAYPEAERGYVSGLYDFFDAIESAYETDLTESELMVGSLEHQYAGRFDLVLTLSKPVEVVTKTYPKRKDKVEEIPAGRYLLDLKTSKNVYNTHYLQLEAYEAAAVECGYQPTDYRGVVHVTADGRYELALNKDWCLEDFLAVRQVYQVLNEREVLRTLREDLDAKEVKA